MLNPVVRLESYETQQPENVTDEPSGWNSEEVTCENLFLKKMQIAGQ